MIAGLVGAEIPTAAAVLLTGCTAVVLTTLVLQARRRRSPRLLGTGIAILILIMLAFTVKRLVIDLPNLAAGTLPDNAYDTRFVRHPWLTYLHIAPGVLYMVGATLQLAYWFRSRHYTVHRRMGRILLMAGLLTGVTAVVIGLWFPFGGLVEASAVVLFSI
jgi:Predicted membrane protein (DUF2306)